MQHNQELIFTRRSNNPYGYLPTRQGDGTYKIITFQTTYFGSDSVPFDLGLNVEIPNGYKMVVTPVIPGLNPIEITEQYHELYESARGMNHRR